MRIGVTGHSKITADSVPLVEAALRQKLAEYPKPVTGVTCLARGADQLFARAVLDIGGSVEVILPSRDYRERKVKPDNREDFELLFTQATKVRVLSSETANRDAYADAGKELLETVDHLIAVYDGAPPDGTGGTGDTVRTAISRNMPVTVVWPEGASRSRDV